MKEISVGEFIGELDTFRADGIDYQIKFMSPAKESLTLHSDSIYTENPDCYVLVDYDEAESGNTIKLNELISRFCDLGEDYYDTLIDFLQPDKKSMIINEDSIYISEDKFLVIQFDEYMRI